MSAQPKPLVREVTLSGGAAAVPGRVYVVDGKPKICPVGQTTISGMLTALGGTTAQVADMGVRNGAFSTLGEKYPTTFLEV